MQYRREEIDINNIKPVPEFAIEKKVTRAGVYKAIKEGRLNFVEIWGKRFVILDTMAIDFPKRLPKVNSLPV